VKLEKTSRIGENVVDENLKAVGTVFDIFGPVSSPYASVRPTVRQPESLANKMLYVVPPRRREEKRRR
jgi:rRNA processing protein Gar1